MSAEAKGLLAAAATTAAYENHRSVQSVDLAQALVKAGAFGQLVDSESASEMMQLLRDIPREEPVFGTPVDVYVYSDPLKRILAYALEEAQRNGETQIQVSHLVVGLLVEGECVPARLLQTRGIDLTRVRSAR